MLNNHSHSTQNVLEPQTSFLSSCFSVPSAREKLQNGIKLHELDQIRVFLERHKEQELLRKEFGYLLQDLEFLESAGALSPPAFPPDTFLSISPPHWIAIRGRFQTDACSLEQFGMDSRVIVNTPSVMTRVLSLSKEAWECYQLSFKTFFVEFGHELLPPLIYFLKTVHCTDVSAITQEYVRYVYNSYPIQELIDLFHEYLECLREWNRVDDDNLLEKLASQEYCIPSNKWIECNDVFYTPIIPTYYFLKTAKNDYTGNNLSSWSFFLSHA